MTDPAETPGAAASEQDATTVLPENALHPGELEALRQELAAAQAKAADHWSAYLRAAAELDNFRKRAARDVENARQYGAERFAAELLPVADSLELGLAARDKADAATLADGLEATLRLLDKAFEKSGVASLDPLGQPFNPTEHEAMVTQPSPGVAANTILTVVQKGYVLNGRLLRPARVVVSRAPDG